MINITTYDNIQAHRPTGNKSIKRNDRPILNNNFNFKYICKEDGFSAVANLLSDKTFLEANNLLFKDPSEYFVSLRAYPFNVYKYWRTDENWKSEFIKVANTEIKTAVSKQSVTGWIMPIGADFYPIGKFKVDSSNSFLNFQSTFKLYIPFCGSLELNANDIINRTIWIYMSVDFETGNCQAYIQREAIDSKDEELLTTVNGKIGYDVAMGKTNANENARNILTGSVVSAVAGVGGVVAGAVTGNPLLVAGGVATAIGGVIKTGWSNSMEQISKISNSSSSNHIINPYKCFLEVHEPILNDPDFKYSEFKGRPLEEVKQLIEMTGLTVVEDVHLENFETASSSEINEIESLLKDGVIL